MSMTDALIDLLRRDGRPLNVLAQATGVDIGILSRLLRRQRSPTLATADRIVRGLGYDVRFTKRRKKG